MSPQIAGGWWACDVSWLLQETVDSLLNDWAQKSGIVQEFHSRVHTSKKWKLGLNSPCKHADVYSCTTHKQPPGGGHLSPCTDEWIKENNTHGVTGRQQKKENVLSRNVTKYNHMVVKTNAEDMRTWDGERATVCLNEEAWWCQGSHTCESSREARPAGISGAAPELWRSNKSMFVSNKDDLYKSQGQTYQVLKLSFKITKL